MTKQCEQGALHSWALERRRCALRLVLRKECCCNRNGGIMRRRILDVRSRGAKDALVARVCRQQGYAHFELFVVRRSPASRVQSMTSLLVYFICMLLMNKTSPTNTHAVQPFWLRQRSFNEACNRVTAQHT